MEILEFNRYECDLMKDGERIPLTIVISNSLADDKDGGWYTCVKIDPLFPESDAKRHPLCPPGWRPIYGADPWQSMLLATQFVYIYLSSYSKQLYFKDSPEKIPFDAAFCPYSITGKNGTKYKAALKRKLSKRKSVDEKK